MSTHNICFRQEVRKIICGYPLLSVVMNPKPDQVLIFIKAGHNYLVLCGVTWGGQMHAVMKFEGSHKTCSIQKT